MVLLWWGTRRQARGDEEKIEPSVHVLRFEIKMMRHREAHNESSPDWMLMGEGSRVCLEYLAYNMVQHSILT
jgi:hypothetical protein